jgi:pimeloyl-ACP methyl ester carboxylesterase
MAAAGRYLKLNGHRIYYEQYGSGPPLVMVHGLAASTSWWRRNIPCFAQHYTVYALDLVGFGHSRSWLPLGVDDAAELLAAFIAALGHQRVDLMAHSLGGHISLLLAARYPERVNKLVLAAAAGGAAMWASMPAMICRALMASLYCGPRFLPIVTLDSLRAGPIVLWKAATNLLQSDIRPLYAQIHNPTLLIWGDRDVLVPIRIGDLLLHALPNVRIEIIQRAGHVVMFDQAERFNQLALDFLLQDQSV